MDVEPSTQERRQKGRGFDDAAEPDHRGGDFESLPADRGPPGGPAKCR